jgi:hypothetical protein
MRDRLLRADGIDPGGVSGTEVARFRRLLSPAKGVHLSVRRRWRSSLAKLAVAAAMVITTARAKTFLWTGTSALVWAAVLRKVKDFETCVYRSREITTTGPRPDGFEFATETETKEYRSEIYGSFSETYENGTDSPPTPRCRRDSICSSVRDPGTSCAGAALSVRMTSANCTPTIHGGL